MSATNTPTQDHGSSGAHRAIRPGRLLLIAGLLCGIIARRFGNYLKYLYQHVRIAYRTPTQLGLLERFHETLKCEEVYWRRYDDPAHARACLAEFRQRDNQRRPHWALVPETGGDPWVPEEVYAWRPNDSDPQVAAVGPRHQVEAGRHDAGGRINARRPCPDFADFASATRGTWPLPPAPYPHLHSRVLLRGHPEQVSRRIDSKHST